MANKDKVNVGKPLVSGAVYAAPYYGQTQPVLPTSADAELGHYFGSVGYISEDGVTWSYSGETDEFRAWGGDVVHRETQQVEDRAQFTMLETVNLIAEQLYWGYNAVETATGSHTISVGDPDQMKWAVVIDMLLKNSGIRRIVIPIASVAERGDITYADDELVGYDVTLQAEKDSSGKYHYEYVQLTASSTSSTSTSS